ncbi:MAG: DEAD/DEAH box helicase, partial [Planctomycetota bacterium]
MTTRNIDSSTTTDTAGSFDELGLSAALLRAVAAEGYTTPTPIQAESIPPVLAGRDVLGCAQTGTGKTAAFSLPILDLLSEDGADRRRGGRRLPRVLILSPTRELATQIADSIRTYGRHTRLKHVVIYGGVSQHRQVRALDAGVDIIVATPGRLMDLMEQGFVDLSEVETFILDEADRMLDMGFIQPIRQIAQNIPDELRDAAGHGRREEQRLTLVG